MEKKKLNKIKLNQESIINRLSSGQMKRALGGGVTDKCIAGCGSNCSTQSSSENCSMYA